MWEFIVPCSLPHSGRSFQFNPTAGDWRPWSEFSSSRLSHSAAAVAMAAVGCWKRVKLFVWMVRQFFVCSYSLYWQNNKKKIKTQKSDFSAVSSLHPVGGGSKTLSTPFHVFQFSSHVHLKQLASYNTMAALLSQPWISNSEIFAIEICLLPRSSKLLFCVSHSDCSAIGTECKRTQRRSQKKKKK